MSVDTIGERRRERMPCMVKELKRYAKVLSRQQLRTIRGLIIKGDTEAAQKGLETILRRIEHETGKSV